MSKMNTPKPEYLKAGDTVGVVSLSAGLASIFPHVYKSGLQVLEEWGLKVKEFASTRGSNDYLKSNPEARAADMNAAFADTQVKAIITTIGGNDSLRILPFLDANIIKSNPKIFMGFSDTTAQHFYLGLLGMQSYYGPSIMAGFSQMNALEPAFKEHVRQVLFGEFDGTYKPYHSYCEGYPNWQDPSKVGQVNPIKPTDGWHWLQGEMVVTGRLFGGCIELFQMLSGTQWWPKADFWADKILFFETSEEVPSIDFITYQLQSMGVQGVFENLKGLIIGRPRDYTPEMKQQLETRIQDQVKHELNRPDMPVITNFDIGHTDPQLILPLNTLAQINPKTQTIKLI